MMPYAVAGHAGGFVQGWEQQFTLLADNVSASLPLHKRTPQAGNRPLKQMWLAQLIILWSHPMLIACRRRCRITRVRSCNVDGMQRVHGLAGKPERCLVQVLYRGRISQDKRDVLRRQFAACREVPHLSPPRQTHDTGMYDAVTQLQRHSGCDTAWMVSVRKCTHWQHMQAEQGHLRRTLLPHACDHRNAAQVFKAMHHSDQEVMNLWQPQVKLDEACQWRCVLLSVERLRSYSCMSTVSAEPPCYLSDFEASYALHLIRAGTWHTSNRKLGRRISSTSWRAGQWCWRCVCLADPPLRLCLWTHASCPIDTLNGSLIGSSDARSVTPCHMTQRREPTSCAEAACHSGVSSATCSRLSRNAGEAATL